MTFQALTERYVASPDIQRQAIYPLKCQIITKKLLPYFSNQLIAAITPSLIERYREHRRQDLGCKAPR